MSHHPVLANLPHFDWTVNVSAVIAFITFLFGLWRAAKKRSKDLNTRFEYLDTCMHKLHRRATKRLNRYHSENRERLIVLEHKVTDLRRAHDMENGGK